MTPLKILALLVLTALVSPFLVYVLAKLATLGVLRGKEAFEERRRDKLKQSLRIARDLPVRKPQKEELN